jgi:hypothetical protein
VQIFYAIAGQSIYDVCLNTYGTLDNLFRLLQDNAFVSLNISPYSGQPFIWDDSLVFSQAINASYAASGKRYATDLSGNGSIFYVSLPSVSGPPPTHGTGPGDGGSVPKTKTYQMVYNTSYTCASDGQTAMSPLDIFGSSLLGFDIVQVTMELKQLTSTQYSWNKSTGILTLISGLSMSAGQTLFILYSKIVST